MGLEDVARLAGDLAGVRRTALDGLAEWRYHGRLVARQLGDVHLVIQADTVAAAAQRRLTAARAGRRLTTAQGPEDGQVGRGDAIHPEPDQLIETLAVVDRPGQDDQFVFVHPADQVSVH